MLIQNDFENNGWVLELWYGGHKTYIHSKYNIEKDDFFVSATYIVPEQHLEILVEKGSPYTHDEKLFDGYITTKEELEWLMKRLNLFYKQELE